MPGRNWEKIKQMLSITLRLNFCYLKIIHILHPSLSENDRTYSKKKAKNKYVCIHEVVRLIITKMKIKMKSRSRRYLHDTTQINPGLDQVINRSRSICVHTQIW